MLHIVSFHPPLIPVLWLSLAAIATLMYLSISPFFFFHNSLSLSLLSFFSSAPFYIPSPGSWRGLITLVLVSPPFHRSAFPALCNIFLSSWCTRPHLVCLLHTHPRFVQCIPFPLIKKQYVYRRNLPVTRFQETVICSCLGTISES